jgi:hypothetical protein
VCDGVIRAILDALFGRDDEAEEEQGVDESMRRDRWRISKRDPWDRRHTLEWRWRGLPREKRSSFAREVEARFRETERGSELVDLIHRHRVGAVKVLLSIDGRRALRAAATPLVRRTVTTDDVLAYQLTDDDIENVERLLVLTERLGGEEMREAVEHTRRLIGDGTGRTLKNLLANE